MRIKQDGLMIFLFLSAVKQLLNTRTYFKLDEFLFPRRPVTNEFLPPHVTRPLTTTTMQTTSSPHNNSVSSIPIHQSLTVSSNGNSHSSRNSSTSNNNMTFGIFDDKDNGIDKELVEGVIAGGIASVLQPTTATLTATTTTTGISKSPFSSCNSTLSLGPITVSNSTSHFNSDQFVNLVKVWSNSNNNNNNNNNEKEHQAICHLSWNGTTKWDNMYHFPHTMQILYRCWSWWQSNYPTKSPILWIPNKKTKQRLMGKRASDFNRGFMTSLETFANISIRLQEPFSTAVMEEQPPPQSQHLSAQQQLVHHLSSSRQQQQEQTAKNSNKNVTTTIHGRIGEHHDNHDVILQQASLVDDHDSSRPYHYHIAQPFGPKYQGETPVHFHALRDVILSGIGKRTSSSTKEETSFFPRIAILNREGSRKLLNAPEIAHEVELRLSSLLWNKKNVVSPQAPPPPPPPTKKGEQLMRLLLPEQQQPTIRIESFEGWSFEEQVQFMSTVDVLISPHGAQLTSIPFLPNCASVFEILPKGYDSHGFFGLLAATSGIEHSYAYLTGGNITSEISEGMMNRKNRNKSRDVQLCPPISDIVEMIVSVVERWRDRCNGGTVENSSLI